jgi:hypothetical protein
MPVAVVLMGHNNDSLVIAERNGGNDGRLPIPQAHNAHSENLADIGEKVRLTKSGSFSHGRRFECPGIASCCMFGV